jgi:HK97 family phage prohead protease
MPEHRFVEVEMEGRAVVVEGSPDQNYVSGVGIVYDRETEIWPGYMEKIRKGAFERTLSSGDEIKSFFNHQASMVLSTTRSKPKLELEDRDDGLHFNSPIPPTSYGNDLRVNLERKNVRGASFSFDIGDGGDIITRDEKGVYHREIVKATLYEIGPVTNPAYRQTKVGLRSEEDVAKDIEKRFAEKTPCRDESGEIEIVNHFLSTVERG